MVEWRGNLSGGRRWIRMFSCRYFTNNLIHLIDCPSSTSRPLYCLFLYQQSSLLIVCSKGNHFNRKHQLSVDVAENYYGGLIYQECKYQNLGSLWQIIYSSTIKATQSSKNLSAPGGPSDITIFQTTSVKTASDFSLFEYAVSGRVIAASQTPSSDSISQTSYVAYLRVHRGHFLGLEDLLMSRIPMPTLHQGASNSLYLSTQLQDEYCTNIADALFRSQFAHRVYQISADLSRTLPEPGSSIAVTNLQINSRSRPILSTQESD